MHGLEEVQTRGSTKECHANFWLTHEADKGGRTVTPGPGDTTEVTKNKSVSYNVDQDTNTPAETIVGIPWIHDVTALYLKDDVCVKLEDDQGGGIIYTTEALDKPVQLGYSNENCRGHRIQFSSSQADNTELLHVTKYTTQKHNFDRDSFPIAGQKKCSQGYQNSDSVFVGNFATLSQNEMISVDTFPTNNQVQSYSVATIPTCKSDIVWIPFPLITKLSSTTLKPAVRDPAVSPPPGITRPELTTLLLLYFIVSYISEYHLLL